MHPDQPNHGLASYRCTKKDIVLMLKKDNHLAISDDGGLKIVKSC